MKHKLGWNTSIETVSFDPVLVTLAEGLKESVHPYAFVARQGFVELLQVPDAGVKTLPVLPKLVAPIRAAISHQDSKVTFYLFILTPMECSLFVCCEIAIGNWFAGF